MRVAKKHKVSVTASKKTAQGDVEEVVNGVVADPTIKQNTPLGVVGMNLGVTLNMGNYESLRIDVWSTEEVAENETREEATDRLSSELTSILDKVRCSLDVQED